MQVVPDGRACECGRSGCWEQYSSGNALVRNARTLMAEQPSVLEEMSDGNPERVTGPMVTSAAEQGDLVARRAFASVGDWLGVGTANLVAALDPAVVVIGGGVSAAGDRLAGPGPRCPAPHASGSRPPDRPRPRGRPIGHAGRTDRRGAAGLVTPAGRMAHQSWGRVAEGIAGDRHAGRGSSSVWPSVRAEVNGLAGQDSGDLEPGVIHGHPPKCHQGEREVVVGPGLQLGVVRGLQDDHLLLPVCQPPGRHEQVVGVGRLSAEVGEHRVRSRSAQPEIRVQDPNEGEQEDRHVQQRDAPQAQGAA